jgi:hypothetical protein
MLQLSIPEPCHENWHEMNPTQKGAFCAVCSKEVVDFSIMTDTEVQFYFLNNVGKKTCGRFKKEQLKGISIVVDEDIIFSNIALWKRFLAAVLICFGSLLTACDNNSTKDKPAANQTNITTTFTLGGAISTNDGEDCSLLTGDTIAVNVVQTPPAKVSCKEIKVENIYPEYIQGDIYIEPPLPPERPEEVPVKIIEDPKPYPVDGKVKDSLNKPGDSCNAPFYL